MDEVHVVLVVLTPFTMVVTVVQLCANPPDDAITHIINSSGLKVDQSYHYIPEMVKNLIRGPWIVIIIVYDDKK